MIFTNSLIGRVINMLIIAIEQITGSYNYKIINVLLIILKAFTFNLTVLPP